MKDFLEKLEEKKAKFTKEFERLQNELKQEKDIFKSCILRAKISEIYGHIDEINDTILYILMRF